VGERSPKQGHVGERSPKQGYGGENTKEKSSMKMFCFIETIEYLTNVPTDSSSLCNGAFHKRTLTD